MIYQGQPVSETLRNAARIIRRRGWTQGRYVDEKTGAVCALQAISLAQGGVSWYREQLRTLGFLRNELLDKQTLGIFNDYECESANDVIALFEIGADIAECKEWRVGRKRRKTNEGGENVGTDFNVAVR